MRHYPENEKIVLTDREIRHPDKTGTGQYDRDVMKTRLSERLSYKQARNTLILTFLIGGLFSVIQVTLDFYQQDHAIDQEMQALLNISSTPAARIAYNIDEELAQELLLGLLRSPTIIRAEITDENNTPLAAISRDIRHDTTRVVSDTLFGKTRQYQKPLRVAYDPEEKLGFLILEIDTYIYGSSFIKRSVVTAVTAIIKGLVLAIVLLLLFYRMTTQPLSALTRDLRRVNNHARTPIALKYPAGHEYDEIGSLVDSINRLLHVISTNLKKRRQAEKQLRNYLVDLENIVDNRTAELNARNRQLRDSNEELDQARQNAEQMAKTRASMLASMSHEVRTPINGILGMIDLLLRDNPTESQKEKLQLARESGIILVQLLNDVLDFSKFESDKLTIETIIFDLHDTLETATALLGQSAADKGLILQNQLDRSLPHTVMGDPTRLHQILTNLLGNAIKFTHHGSVTLRAWANVQSDQRCQLRVEIRDTGIGIPEAMQGDIFTAFSQASSDTTRKFGGTGLGLALSKKIAEAMGGSITVESQPNEGSRFTVVMPFEQTVQEPTPQPLHSHETIITGTAVAIMAPPILASILYDYCREWQIDAWVPSWQGPWQQQDLERLSKTKLLLTHNPHLVFERQNPTVLLQDSGNTAFNTLENDLVVLPLPIRKDHLHATLSELIGSDILHATTPSMASPHIIVQESSPITTRILVVEDNPTNLMVAEGMLEQLGYQVTTARNGQQCLDRCKKALFDLVLMDCNMPVMDGYEACRQLRNNAKTCDIPVIALTANALSHDRERCYRAGMQDYIAKPFDRSTLKQTLEKWL